MNWWSNDCQPYDLTIRPLHTSFFFFSKLVCIQFSGAPPIPRIDSSWKCCTRFCGELLKWMRCLKFHSTVHGAFLCSIWHGPAVSKKNSNNQVCITYQNQQKQWPCLDGSESSDPVTFLYLTWPSVSYERPTWDVVKALGWTPYHRASMAVPLWCGLGCHSRTNGRIHRSRFLFKHWSLSHHQVSGCVQAFLWLHCACFPTVKFAKLPKLGLGFQSHPLRSQMFGWRKALQCSASQ